MKRYYLSLLAAIAAAITATAQEFAPCQLPDFSDEDIAAAESRIARFHPARSRAAGDNAITSRDDLLGAWVQYFNSPGNIYGSIQNLWANHFIINPGYGENEVYLQNIMNEKNTQIKGSVDVASGYIDITFPQLVGFDGGSPIYLYSYDIERNTPLLAGTINLEIQRNSYDNKLEFIANLPMVYYVEDGDKLYMKNISFYVSAKQPNARISYMHAETAGTPTEADYKPIDYRIDVIPGYDKDGHVTAMQVSTVTANGVGIPVVFTLEYPGTGIAQDEVGDYIYKTTYTKPVNGYFQLCSIMSASSFATTVGGSFNSDMTKFEFDSRYNWMLYDVSLGSYQGENKPATITFDVPFPAPSNLAAITDIDAPEAEGPITYYNIYGQRVDNPRQGQLLIRRQGASATKVLIK